LMLAIFSLHHVRRFGRRHHVNFSPVLKTGEGTGRGRFQYGFVERSHLCDMRHANDRAGGN